MSYAELQVTSNFSFLRGASHPEELVLQAHAFGLDAIALTDRNTLAGVVRAHCAAREVGLRLVVGARLDLLADDSPPPRKERIVSGPFDRADGRTAPAGRGAEARGAAASLLCFPTDRAAYGRLSQLISKAQRRVEKGLAALWLDDVLEHAEGQILIALPPPVPDPAFERFLAALRSAAPGRTYLAAQFLYRGDDRARIERLAALAVRHRTPLVATGDVLYHTPERRPLQDVLSCIREKCTIDEAGLRLLANAERHLKPVTEMARLFRHWPEAVARTAEIVRACRFSLDELAYDYPIDAPPDGLTVQGWLERLTFEGAAERYPAGVPAKVRDLLRHELRLIEELDYAPYFLTVHDIVRYARSRGILCQGRGSAANSAVCYCLGITAVDPGRFDLLFERFVSAERNEPPDIDVDFEHERREEVIQYIYGKYGREHAGIAATVIHYRTRSAIREVGKALGLSADVVGGLAGSIWGWSNDGVAGRDLEERGLDPEEPRIALAVRLSRELIGFPRHLSQHVGGFVLTRSRLDQVVPVVNAAMPDRTFVEWDKDDLDALGILKIDVLGLGMLTCIRKAFELLEEHHGRRLGLADVPPEDPEVYEMLGRGDSIGVFQVESRAQMTMLPRLKPTCFYDLIVEVAIVRPGPIQGDMVHPYLRRRAGLEPVSYPSDELKGVLEKTLGVPLFQEQAMKIAIIGAGFTPSESDRLRRAMATFKRAGTIDRLGARFIEGMVLNGYERDFAEKCFRQIEGFGTYGFPESHAASFALLVYVSSWIKCHYPEVFAAALLNSQPMGFYAPAQIVRDAKDHGVTVRPVDVNASAWDCTLEPTASADPSATPPADGRGDRARRFALRLGFRQVKGLKEEEMRRLVEARGRGYHDLGDLRTRARIGQGALDRLARADAFGSMRLDRRGAIWSAIGLDGTGRELDPPPLFAWADAASAGTEPAVDLPPMSTGQHVAEDYRTLRLTLRTHPLALLRPRLPKRTIRAEDLARIEDGRWVEAAGLVLVRQRPGTASGVIFVTLEDETGVINLVVWPRVFERFRRVVLGSQMMAVQGKVQKEGLVIHVVAGHLADRTDLLRGLSSAEIEAPVARADRVKRPNDRRSRTSPQAPPFDATLAHADHGKSSGGPDPRDPLWRPRDIDHYRSHPHLVPAPLARADEVKRNTRNTRPAPDERRHPHESGKVRGFKSRDFH
ncbi:MAG TPA: error-prone DNA polymerase [Geminicoccaceae bacterium]